MIPVTMVVIAYLPAFSLLVGSTIMYVKVRSIPTLLFMLGAWFSLMSIGSSILVAMYGYTNKVFSIVASAMLFSAPFLLAVGIIWYSLALKYDKKT